MKLFKQMSSMCGDCLIFYLNFTEHYFSFMKIIQMHGFIKLHKRRKVRLERSKLRLIAFMFLFPFIILRKSLWSQEELLEALSTIDLMHPPRSTLNEGSSPYDSSLTIDEVNKDLEALEWQECPVQSLQTLGPSKPTIDGAGNDVSPAFKITVKKPRTKRRKTRRISDLSRGFA